MKEKPWTMIRQKEDGQFCVLTAFEDGSGETTDEINLLELMKYVVDTYGSDLRNEAEIKKKGN